MRKIKKIIIHCAFTPEGREDNAADIDRWHKENGWSGIGYHYVILLDGTIEKGRPDAKQGVHCKGHNSNSIGVVYIGGADKSMKAKDTRTEAQKVSLRNLVAELLDKYPEAKIYGHNDLASKDCPCFNVRTEL